MHRSNFGAVDEWAKLLDTVKTCIRRNTLRPTGANNPVWGGPNLPELVVAPYKSKETINDLLQGRHPTNATPDLANPGEYIPFGPARGTTPEPFYTFQGPFTWALKNQGLDNFTSGMPLSPYSGSMSTDTGSYRSK